MQQRGREDISHIIIFPLPSATAALQTRNRREAWPAAPWMDTIAEAEAEAMQEEQNQVTVPVDFTK